MLELIDKCIDINKEEIFKKIENCFNKTIVERNIVKLNMKIEKKIFIFNYIINKKSIQLLDLYGNRNFAMKILFKLYKFIYQSSFNKINKNYYKIA